MSRYIQTQGVALDCGCHAAIKIVTQNEETWAESGRIQMECLEHRKEDG